MFPLTESITTLGRSPSNSIQVTDKRASRFHAEIVRRGRAFCLRDLKSKNGTSVKGVRMTEEHALCHGDDIRIGQTLYVFEDEEADRKGSTTSGIRLADDAATRTRGSIPAGITRALEAADNRKAEEPSTEGTRRFSVLLRVMEKVRSILDLDHLLAEILDLVFNVLHPERGFIMLHDPKTGVLVPKVVKMAGEREEITLSRTIVHQALRERMGLLISDAIVDQRFQAIDSIVSSRVRSAICVPLIAQDDVLGVLYIDSHTHKVDYGQKDLELLTGIANQAAMAISNALLHQNLVEQNRLERELEIARTIQANLLPHHPPIVPGFDIAAMTVPAKRVGGDYYDFIEIDPDRLGVAVADVSGKGVPAAILTASIRAALQAEARRPETPLETILENLNAMACRDAANNMFVALFFGILQVSTRRFRYINAGHCYPLIFDANRNEKPLDKGGCVLGVMPDRKFEQDEVRLAPGSTLLIYSDGVTDILNEHKEAFGLDRVRKIVHQHLDSTAEELRQAIHKATTAHMGRAEQFDDYTLVVIKAL